MAAEIIIIDGYNLLWRGFDYRTACRDLSSQRVLLEAQLKEYLRRLPDVKMILVYDGALFIDDEVKRQPDRLHVVYSRPPQTADQLIVEECRRRGQAGGGGRLTVVTSDSKDIVRQLSSVPCRHRTSEEFAAELESLIEKARRPRKAGKPPVPRNSREKPATISAAEVNEWLEVFSKPKKRR